MTMGIAGWLFSTGRWVIPTEIQLVTANPVAWATYTFILLMVSALFVLLPTYMLMHLSEALAQSRAMARELEADREQAQLEAQRKHNHAEQLGWAAALGHTLTSMRQREDVVQRVVREIAQTFDIHQATLYLMGRSGTVLNVAATAGHLGEALLQDEGDIPINARIAPARAAQIGREQMALLLPGELPRFPQSRVEISLPLSVRGEVLGVLDIHSLHPTFSEEELQIFRIVANHVAASLDVLRLLEESKTRVQETQMLYTQHASASWRTLLESRNVQAFIAGKASEAQTTALAQEAMTALQPRSAWLEDAGMHVLIVPLVAHSIPVGYLAFTRAAEKGDWDVDTRDLISMAAERLAAALDNARMLIDARQQLLYNERLGRLGDLIWQAPSPEDIMQQSVRELGRFLEASEVQLYLTPQGGARRGRGTQPLPSRAEQGEAGND
ncbi:MAG TPA: GAF domain-containing protein [Anaerolineae bacterium]|nr:GAF domain-containing protein [Anaerolineae bacterium]HQI83976.1 GAF domain-containing protein [Anaerolineae bacterium]